MSVINLAGRAPEDNLFDVCISDVFDRPDMPPGSFKSVVRVDLVDAKVYVIELENGTVYTYPANREVRIRRIP